jgi:tail lysozyme
MARLAPGQVVDALVARGVPKHIAQGVAMNFMDESGLETGMQEQAPTAGRGGYGLAQWTGPRRVALEDYARAQGKPVNDPDLQLDFFMNENQGPEAAAWKAVMASPTARDAAVAFVNQWERPASQYAAQRSAKYGGTDVAQATSPYELQARHPGSPQVGTGGYVAPGAPKTPVPVDKKPKAGKFDNIGSAIAGAGEALGQQQAPSMGRAPQLPSMAPAALDPVAMVNPQADAVRRDQLAMLMQRLNAGTLWG